MASRLAQAGKQRAREFDHMLVEIGCEEIRRVPELLAYQQPAEGDQAPDVRKGEVRTAESASVALRGLPPH